MCRGNPSHHCRPEGTKRRTEGVSSADSRRANLGWKYFSRISETGTKTASDQKVCDQSNPEQTCVVFNVAHHYEQNGCRYDESWNYVTTSPEVTQPAACPIGENGDKHPDRQPADRNLESQFLLGGQEMGHPCRPTNPGKEIKTIDQRRDQHFAGAFPDRRKNIKGLLQS